MLKDAFKPNLVNLSMACCIFALLTIYSYAYYTHYRDAIDFNDYFNAGMNPGRFKVLMEADTAKQDEMLKAVRDMTS